MRHLVCTDWNETTQQCDVQAWQELETGFPDLPVADAQLIGAALATTWVIVWILKKVIKWSEQQ